MRHHLCSLFLFLSALLYSNPSLAYSLKNCTVKFPERVTDISVTCTNRGLTSVPEDIPRNATSLDLSNNQISLSEPFGVWIELRELDMSSNALTNLTDNMFQGLSKLIQLSLSQNQIQYISPLAFQSLTSLQTVELNNNNLSQLSDIAPILQLPNIYSLEVGMNRFTSFESAELPFYTSNLRRLLLSLNPLIKFSITRDVFPYLNYIDLTKSSSGFEWALTDRAFLRSLKNLFLGGAEVSFQMYKLILHSTFAVEYLALTYLNEWFDKGLIDVACQMPALKYLDLYLNDIHILNDTLLQPCSKITKLGLSKNQINDLSENALRPLSQLEMLMLDSNFLPKVPVAVRGLSKLLVLSLGSNDIGELGCSDFKNLSSLLQLILDDNRISVLRGCAFQDLKNLTDFSVKRNPIFKVLDTFRVSLHNLVNMDINMNEFTGFKTGDFQDMPFLQSLDLKSVFDCCVANGTFQGLHRLKALVLSPHSLNKDVFRGMPNLQSLQLHLPTDGKNFGHQINSNSPFVYLPFLRSLSIHNSNKLSVVISPDLLRGLHNLQDFAADTFFTETPHPNTFSYTPHLTSVQIIHSHALSLTPELFQQTPNLRYLDLSMNRLTSLDFLTQANLSTLHVLLLGSNELTVVSEVVFQSLPALTYLDLSGNPFACDCQNLGFIQWVKNNNQTQVRNAYQYECCFPSTKQGTRLLEFDIQSCKMNSGFLCFIFTTCVVLLTLFTSFTYNFLRWQIVCAYYLFLAFIYDSRKRKKAAPKLYDAFISYNVHDEAWVYEEMVPVLEGEQGWRLCLHHRDFQPGKPIIENIIDAIYSSSKTICVITRRYLQSEWCSREIQMASFRLFDEQKDVLILLFLEEIPDRELSPYYRMRRLVRRRTYLSWPKAGQHSGVFWQNVRRALETGNAPIEDANIFTASLSPNN